VKTTYTLMEFGGDDWGVWECSKCGIAWNLEADGPAENHMNFCPHCGRRITFVVSHGEWKYTGAEYNEDDPHCEECDGESHVRGCLMFGDPE
jgi:hypothetical protein